MYLEHFQLERQPFSEHAAMAALWQDGRMAEGLARLEYLVAHGVLGLVTGPTGVGKSALLKQFLHGLAAQHCEAVYCHLSHLPSAERGLVNFDDPAMIESSLLAEQVAALARGEAIERPSQRRPEPAVAGEIWRRRVSMFSLPRPRISLASKCSSSTVLIGEASAPTLSAPCSTAASQAETSRWM